VFDCSFDLYDCEFIKDVDIVHLQLALTSLVEWANEWQLAISIEKFCVLKLVNKHLHLTCNWAIVRYLLFH